MKKITKEIWALVESIIKKTWDLNPELVVGVIFFFALALIALCVRQRREAEKELTGQHDT